MFRQTQLPKVIFYGRLRIESVCVPAFFLLEASISFEVERDDDGIYGMKGREGEEGVKGGPPPQPRRRDMYGGGDIPLRLSSREKETEGRR